MTEKRFKLDLSRHLFIVSALIILVLSCLAIDSFNMPSPDYSGIDEVTFFCYKIWSLILIFDILFFGILGGYHIASKVLAMEDIS